MVPQGMNRQNLLMLGCLLGLMCLAVAQGGGRLLSDAMIQTVYERFGKNGQESLIDWASFVMEQERQHDDQQELKTLTKVNQYFNRNLTFVSDESHWQKQDYWATPLESLSTRGGDCEDFVIAKYFSLIQAGVAQDKLRITYVKALKLNQAHMVLAYYATPSSEPLILDNLTQSIERASKRRDLAPVYSFNGMGMWIERQQGRSIKVGSASRLSMWMDVLLRMEQQGLQPWLELPQADSVKQ